MKYKTVATKTNVRRPFRIVAGLREGYAGGSFVHKPIEAISLIHRWMKGRAEAGKSYLTGSFSEETMVYTWKGAKEKDDAPEPAIVFQGEVSIAYNPDLTDNEVKEILSEIGVLLGSELGQTRVYISYLDGIWIIQAEEKSSPRVGEEKHK